jgi:hypothetical protein
MFVLSINRLENIVKWVKLFDWLCLVPPSIVDRVAPSSIVDRVAPPSIVDRVAPPSMVYDAVRNTVLCVE